MEADEADLVRRAAAGDDGAFAQLFRRHSAYVARVVHRLLGDDGDLDDLVQETFVIASRKLATLDDAARLRGWLAQIAVRRTYRRLEKRARGRLLRERYRRSLPPPTVAPRSAEVLTLHRALDRLAPKLRVPWVLHRIEEETLPRTAELCDISLATAKRRVAEAEQRLRRILDAR